MRSSLEELIDKINADGWLVSDLYQSAPHDWRASLRPVGDWTTSHGEGETPRNALLRAWQQKKKPMTNKEWESYRNPKKEAPVKRVRITR